MLASLIDLLGSRLWLRLSILRGAGYSGPYSVEIEFGGEPWPPLDEVNAAMRRSYEHLSALGLE